MYLNERAHTFCYHSLALEVCTRHRVKHKPDHRLFHITQSHRLVPEYPFMKLLGILTAEKPTTVTTAAQGVT